MEVARYIMQDGHSHPVSILAPIGHVFLSARDLGEGPIEAFGRKYYKANGNNGTHDLMGRFPRMNSNALTTGGSDFVTLTINEMPEHHHDIVNTTLGFVDSGSRVMVMKSYQGLNLPVSNTGGGQPHENRPAFVELIPYEAVE